jgi:membrane-bound hydrogenase subunit beta
MAEKKTKKKAFEKTLETPNKQLSPEEIVTYFKDKFTTKIKSAEIKKRATGSKKKEFVNIWMKIDKSIFKNYIEHLCTLTYPHLAVCSGNDLGNQIELVYSFSIYYGKHLQEISLNVGVEVPKNKPEIETICDWIPGALITEREKQEMLGIKIIGIPDNRRLFLPDDFPENVFPWRKDEQTKKEIEKLYKNLNEGVKKK